MTAKPYLPLLLVSPYSDTDPDIQLGLRLLNFLESRYPETGFTLRVNESGIRQITWWGGPEITKLIGKYVQLESNKFQILGSQGKGHLKTTARCETTAFGTIDFIRGQKLTLEGNLYD